MVQPVERSSGAAVISYEVVKLQQKVTRFRSIPRRESYKEVGPVGGAAVG